MSYFEDHYNDFNYPIGTDESAGFRNAQVGAIHAAAAHFTVRADPGIITMPTGSGKTAVLLATAFVLRAKRVIILTPSRLVREQIVDEALDLTRLRELGALPRDIPRPRVMNVRKRIASAEQWEEMRGYDVVVATSVSVSPEYDAIPEPPNDLFDLVLVDEAHHSPARTWKSLLDHFPNARRLLLTATPFRQDQREIKGRFIYTYHLRQAFEDKIFGEIRYKPVVPIGEQSSDIAIARAAEAQLLSDRNEGFNHVLMVRTDGRKRATELLTVYEANTALRLKLVTGEQSLRHVKSVIAELRAGTIDGIVCVNMLGEGFDLPNLKIAAVHSPHHSLAVTLQFIGRFARTAGEHLGPATFLAVPSEIEIQAERLYDSEAVWQEIVQNLSAARVQQEAQIREVLESFELSDLVAPDLADLSLYVLEPYYHAKIFQLDRPIDIRALVEFPENLQVVFHTVSEAHNAAIYITREISQPRWTHDDRLAIVQPDLFVFYQDPATNLLFICASRRTEGLYEQLAAAFSDASPHPLPLVRLNRALNELSKTEFFNVGMRNRISSNTTESYRIVTGSNADRSVQKSDGRLYHRGHCFGRADDQGTVVTIGLSSASKIWSNASSQLPQLIEWFEKLARRINTNRDPITHSGLDNLSVGEEVAELPDNIVCVDWAADTYRDAPVVRYQRVGAGLIRRQLLDLDISIESGRSTEEVVALLLKSGNELEYRFTFSFETNRFFEPASDHEPDVRVESDRDDIPLIDYLNDSMPHFYTGDLSFLQGYSLLKAPSPEGANFDLRSFEHVDWEAALVDIEREFGQAAPGKISIHQYIEQLLAASNAQVAYYDHGPGEVADFIAVEQANGRLTVRFYHCKGAGGIRPGARLGDCYEVLGQAVKSAPYARWQKVLASVRRRFNERIGSHRFVRGDLAELDTILNTVPASDIDFEFVAVQPGLAREGITAPISNLLASTSDYLVRGGFKPLRVMGS